MVCKQCGQELLKDSQFCFICGTKVAEGDEGDVTPTVGRFCISCGQQMLDDSIFCATCGSKLPTDEDDTSIDNERFCIMCGQKLLGDSQFCFTCGAKAPESPQDESLESELSADIGLNIESSDATKSFDIEPTDATKSLDIESTDATKPYEKPDSLKETESFKKADSSQEPAEVTPVEEVSDIGHNDPEIVQDKPPRRVVPKLLGGIVFVLIAIVVGLGFVIIRERLADRNNQPIPAELAIHDPEDTIGGGYYIYRVAQGYLAGHSDITIGTAFESVFANRQWLHFTDDFDNQYVSFFGDTLYHGDAVTIETIFQFSWDTTSFEPVSMRFAGTEVGHGFMMEMLDYIFDEALR